MREYSDCDAERRWNPVKSEVNEMEASQEGSRLLIFSFDKTRGGFKNHAMVSLGHKDGESDVSCSMSLIIKVLIECFPS